MIEPDGDPRISANQHSYNASLNFTYFGRGNQLDYGFEFIGFNTDFTFTNLVGITFNQKDFTTELAGYAKYKQKIGDLIIEPGLRLHFYASQATVSVEPRFGLKYNISDNVRFKAAGGFYSQNLISTANDLDVVNFFVGFLAGPEETLFKPGTTEPTNHRLQKSIHGIAGLEIDLSRRINLNIEPYYKRFTQLITINRNKLSSSDPDFVTETGNAYGVDLALKYNGPKAYIWATYSIAKVDRFDGAQEYPTVFDRRHNVNFLITQAFGQNNSWEASARWNFGSGFPFTQTQGFYQSINFNDLLLTDILTGNYDLGTLLSDERNRGRLSSYHRLDLSLKKVIELSPVFESGNCG